MTSPWIAASRRRASNSFPQAGASCIKRQLYVVRQKSPIFISSSWVSSNRASGKIRIHRTGHWCPRSSARQPNCPVRLSRSMHTIAWKPYRSGNAIAKKHIPVVAVVVAYSPSAAAAAAAAYPLDVVDPWVNRTGGSAATISLAATVVMGPERNPMILFRGWAPGDVRSVNVAVAPMHVINVVVINLGS